MMVGKGIENIDITMPRDTYNIGKGTPTFNAYLTVVVRDSEGRVVKVHRQRSRSPTVNFIGLILPLTYFRNTGNYYTLTNTGGGSYSFMPAISTTEECLSYSNSSTNYPSYLAMIQVGTDSQSNPYSAYSLASPIANGSGSGQLVYGQPSVQSNITVSGSSAYFTILQTFNNSSGATVTITEVGIVTLLQFPQSSGGDYYTLDNTLVWYDVLSSSISVPNGGALTIYYTFTVNP
jgi:hypothetical protein